LSLITETKVTAEQSLDTVFKSCCSRIQTVTRIPITNAVASIPMIIGPKNVTLSLARQSFYGNIRFSGKCSYQSYCSSSSKTYRL